MLIRSLCYGLLPLLVLLFLALVSSFIAFAILRIVGDVLPLAKLISKTTLVLLLLSIFPWKRYLQLSWFDFGFLPGLAFFRQIGQGLLLALATLLPVLLTLYCLDVHFFDTGKHWSVGKLTGKIASTLAVAALIAIVEETLFRGLLLASLRRKLSLWAALGISSLYYAALHFLKAKTPIEYSQQTATSGLQLVVEAFANWLNPDILSALLALFTVGCFLAVIRISLPQSLGVCIGCHAGWVWQIKLSKDLFNLNPHADYLYLVSHYDGVVGPLVSVWLTLVMLIWWGWRRWKPLVATGRS